ncbi:MAG: hypothetical protein ACI4U6_02460 [Acutalibacteraceae bacterium]
MKKNKIMRIAAVLLVAVILTTCAISGTFAKYVTSTPGSDSARVAKFGVTVTGTADTFEKTYAKDDMGFTLAANTVVSTTDVVAPGTDGSMAAFNLTGIPEVAVNVAFTGTLELGDKWVDSDSNYYCPIEITVGSTTFKGTDYASADEFETAVNNEIADYTQDYEANTDLSTIGVDAPAISWKWPFAGDDVKDTYLGNQAATISLDVTATVTQID